MDQASAKVPYCSWNKHEKCEEVNHVLKDCKNTHGGTETLHKQI